MMTMRKQRFGVKSVALALILLALAIRSGSAAQRTAANHANEHDLYKVLGLKRGATAKAIKSKFRKLALRYHPDKVKEEEREEAMEIMAKINEAYAVLGDDDKREVFDKFGQEGLDSLEKGHDPREGGFGGGGNGFEGGGFGGANFGGFNFGGGSHHFQSGGSRGGGGGDPFTEMFKNMFNGGGFGGQQQQQHQQQHQQQQQRKPQDFFPKGRSKVAKLGAPKFPDKHSKHMWLIMFYTTDSPYMSDDAAILEKLAQKTSLAYKVGAVDCGRTKQDAKFCSSKSIDVQTDQQVYAFVVDGKVLPYEDSKDVTPRNLNDFCTNYIPQNLVQNVNNVPQLNERLLNRSGGSKSASILLLSDKYETSGMYYSIAYQFRKTFTPGESKAKNLQFAQQFGVRKYPHLIAFVPPSVSGAEAYNDQYGILRYTGDPKKEDIAKWLTDIGKRISKASSSRRNRTGSDL